MSNRHSIERALQDIRKGMGCKLAADRHGLKLEDLKQHSRRAGLGADEYPKGRPRKPLRFRWRRRRRRKTE